MVSLDKTALGRTAWEKLLRDCFLYKVIHIRLYIRLSHEAGNKEADGDGNKPLIKMNEGGRRQLQASQLVYYDCEY